MDAQKSNPLLPEVFMCKHQFGTINFLIFAGLETASLRAPLGYVRVTDRCLSAEQLGNAGLLV